MIDRSRRAMMRQLPLWERQIFGQGGRVDQHSLACPREARLRPIEDCAGCAWYGGRLPARPPAALCAWSDAPERRRPAREDADEVTVATIMRRVVVCVTADLAIEQVARLFLERGISGAAVVDRDGHPRGVVSKTDLVRERLEGGRGGRTAGDVMTPLVFGLPEDAAVARAAALMAVEGVHRLPILSTDGRVIGVVSALDVARTLAGQRGYLLPRRS